MRSFSIVLVAFSCHRQSDTDAPAADIHTHPYAGCVQTATTEGEDWRSITTYDAHGLWVRSEDVNEADGVTDFIATAERDAHGQIVVLTYDYAADGVVDFRIRYSVDADGDVLDERSDWDGDGTDDVIVTHFYEDGVLVRSERDDGPDGTIDAVTTFINRTSSSGNVVVDASLDTRSDGLVDQTWRSSRDCAGRELAYAGDGDADGASDVELTREYAGDLVIAESWEHFAEGLPDTVVVRSYLYGRDDRVVRATTERQGDYARIEEVTYQYVCEGPADALAV